MELRLLRSFIAVAENRNFGAAAKDLMTTQSALTKQIQVLERQAGNTLFTRGRHGAALTPAGRALLADSVDLVRRADALAHRMQRVAMGAEGVLNVGFGMSALDVAPRAVAVFRSRHPGVDIKLEDMSSTAQFEALGNDSLHVGFVRLPAPPEFGARVIRRDQLALAVPSGVPVPGLDRESLREWLRGRPLVRLLPVRGPGLAAQTSQLFTDLGCSPTVMYETSDLLTVLALVAAGTGSAVVPASVAAIVPGGVQLIPIDLESAFWSIGIAWLRGSQNSLVPLFLASAEAATNDQG
ncbi:LysR family transcriptional regulator [Arthrobacter sp. MYb23]|uniref:LysR family transcriptional regulator n=1 Tax=unclassified Arthrobacter TaxID=235627 RepID=UPI000CFCCF51|nr:MULTISPECIES: LysR family transcriptional regulator [unclassified Arthrobacter]PRB43381.1 LysR family transcriptional regulator [Arthrobacter sp. MYb51]PRB96963.1 LysR family transcriptional regulator [Arthrobacter sp. MYb23]